MIYKYKFVGTIGDYSKPNKNKKAFVYIKSRIKVLKIDIFHLNMCKEMIEKNRGKLIEIYFTTQVSNKKSFLIPHSSYYSYNGDETLVVKHLEFKD